MKLSIVVSCLAFALLFITATAFVNERTNISAKNCREGRNGANNQCCPIEQKPVGDFFDKHIDQDLVDTLNELFPSGDPPRDGAFVANNVGVRCRDRDTSCKVEITWLLEGAGYRNVFGYYFFDTTTRTIRVDNGKQVHYPAFPDTSAFGSKGCLQAGDSVRLFDDVPFDETMAFFLRANGADNTPDGKSSADTYYSTTDYFTEGGLKNDDGFDHLQQEGPYTPTKHFGWVQYNEELIFGCEDLSMGRSGSDRDYNDVMFLIVVKGDWDDVYVPVYECNDRGDCDVYECTKAELVYDGVEFEATVTISQAGQEGLQVAPFAYSWANGGWTVDGTGLLLETHTYDTYCTTEHDGEYLFNQGTCGCEETFIEANQPQLFIEPQSDYYNTPGTRINDFMGTGVDVIHYVRSDTYQAVTDLYLNADNDEIVRAIFDDGRTMDFSDVRYRSQPVALPEAPEGCQCRRNLDVVLLLEKSGDVQGTGYYHVKQFAQQFVRDQKISSDNVNIGFVEYNARKAKISLPVTAGHVESNVYNTANNIACKKADEPCAKGGDGDIIQGLKLAVDLHLRAKRSAAQVIIVVTNGWSASNDDLHSVIDDAWANDITVIAVPYGSTMHADDLMEITVVNGVARPDNIVFRYQALDLSSTDVIDVSSRSCLVADAPCSDCCGVCDTTCGAREGGCQAVDACPVSTSCSKVNIIIDKCCTEVDAGNDAYCSVTYDNQGNLLTGDPSLSNCQVGTCDDSSGEIVCNYVDECVETPCYSAECRYNRNTRTHSCTRSLKPATSGSDSPCAEPQCMTDDLGAEIGVVNVEDCPAATAPCSHAFCGVDADGNPACRTGPTPKPNRGPCDRVDCINDEWVVRDRCSVAATDPCAPEVCEVYTDGCDGARQCTRCVDDESPCDTSDLCQIPTCDSSNGECSYSPVQCPAKPCMDNNGCDPQRGCLYTDRVCESPVHPCESYVCRNDVCEHIEAEDVCDQCTPACVNNLCVKVPCILQECDESQAVVTDCSSDNQCLSTGCDPERGCTSEPITCDHLTPRNACHEFVRDPDFEGCCKEVEKVCEPENPDPCTIYSCDNLEGCKTEPRICPSVACQDFNPAYVGGCSPTGTCSYVDRNCDTQGCATTACNVDLDQCEVLNYDECECACGSNECVTVDCIRGECSDQPVETVCEAKNICEVNIRCDPDAAEPGCQFDLKDCDATMPPVACMEYYRDPTHPDECCQLRPVDCSTSDCTVEECNVDTNQCEVVSREDCPCEPACVNNVCERNSCEYNTTTLFPECVRTSTNECTPPSRCHTSAPCDPNAPQGSNGCVFTPITCDALTPDSCMEYREDPDGLIDPDGTECCVQVPIECPSTGCAIRGCVDNVCVDVDESPCICDPEECINNKCVRHECNEGVCGAETLTDCSTTNTCLIEDGCNPDAQDNPCVYLDVECGETSSPCTYFVKDPTTPGCCVEVDVECISDSCETLVCDADAASLTAGECVVDSRADCPCDEACLINNICVKTTCVEGECSEPILKNCTASDFCHTNPRCDPEVEGGCIEDEVDCGEPPACHEWVKNPSVEECCVAVPIECRNDDGCADLACNVTTNQCEIVSTANCLCQCGPNNVCQETECDDLATGTCHPTVERVCPDSPDTCQNLRGCVVDEGGCVYDPVAPCDDANLSANCTVFVRDPEFAGCCKEVERVCPDLGDKCKIYDPCNVDDNSCPITDKVCIPPPCHIIDPDFATSGGCDPSDGLCVFIPLECNVAGDCEVKACNVTTNTCEVVDDALCSVCTPACANNRCVKTECINQICDLDNAVATDCEARLEGDTCRVVTGCDPVDGCQFAPVDCSATPITACERVVEDSTHPGCCRVEPIECPADTGCYTYSCDDVEGCVRTELCTLNTDCQIEVCVDDACVVTDKPNNDCPVPEDLCQVASCSADAVSECIVSPVLCVSDDPCFTSTCDPADGSCIIAPVDCSDGDLCTDDVCTDGVCSNPSNCEAEDMCRTATCDPAVGECLRAPVVCNDGVSCTTDSCNPETGCLAVPDDARCKSDDVCVISLGCDAELDCQFENRTCEDTDGDFCTLEYCKPFEGCSVVSIDCSEDPVLNETSAEFDEGCGVIYFCDSEAAECAIDPVVCALSTAAIVTVTALGTAAVVGIVVGIVVALALCAGGAGVYSVYKNSDDAAESAVSVNPLYEGSSTGGANPLFQEK